MRHFLLLVTIPFVLAGCAESVKIDAAAALAEGYWSGGKGILYVSIAGDSAQIVLTNGCEIPARLTSSGPLCVRVTELVVPAGAVSNFVPGEVAATVLASGGVKPCVYLLDFDGPDVLTGKKVAWLVKWRALDRKVLGVTNEMERPERWERIKPTNR